jgi:hypothetical protein
MHCLQGECNLFQEYFDVDKLPIHYLYEYLSNPFVLNLLSLLIFLVMFAYLSYSIFKKIIIYFIMIHFITKEN